MNNTVLNLAGLNANEKLEKLISTFETLQGKDSLEVCAETSLQPLLSSFQEKFWGSYDWHPLENGPTQWRVVLHRAPNANRERGLKDFMGFDHYRCDELYAATENAAQSGNLEVTRSLFGAFELGMTHHFNMEEQGFFPAFEQATGMTQGPTMVMRMEHRQMLGVIGQMRQAVNQNDLAGVIRAGTTLMVLMRQHNIKEEQMLYPMGDMHLGSVQPLLRTMQAL
ncbi:MAG: hemerythrin domain-containing protein [Magnetococcales bacterium]|nr:hemerythrin domain-containing protein [Magnetococcales bacterium]